MSDMAPVFGIMTMFVAIVWIVRTVIGYRKQLKLAAIKAETPGSSEPRSRARGRDQSCQPGPRTTRPGVAPVCSPSRSTGTPLTKTWRTPCAYRCGSSNVARSRISRGSNTTTSAK